MVKLTPREIVDIAKTREIGRIERLDARKGGFSTCIGLEACQSLLRLDLSDNAIEELDGIAAINTLKWLSVARNKVDSLFPLRELLNLEVLNVSHNALKDEGVLQPLSRLKKLKAAILNNNDISDLSGISQLHELDTLVLSHNRVTSIEDLGSKQCSLSSLQKLSLSHNPLSRGLEVLRFSSKLQELRLNHCSIKSLPESLELCDKLKILELGSNPIKVISDVAIISKLVSLQQLSLKGCPIASLPDYETTILELCNFRLKIFDNKKISSYHMSQEYERKKLETTDFDSYEREQDDVKGTRRKLHHVNRENSVPSQRTGMKSQTANNKIDFDQNTHDDVQDGIQNARNVGTDNRVVVDDDDDDAINFKELTEKQGEKTEQGVENPKRTGIIRIKHIRQDRIGNTKKRKKNLNHIDQQKHAARGIAASEILRKRGLSAVKDTELPTWDQEPKVE